MTTPASSVFPTPRVAELRQRFAGTTSTSTGGGGVGGSAGGRGGMSGSGRRPARPYTSMVPILTTPESPVAMPRGPHVDHVPSPLNSPEHTPTGALAGRNGWGGGEGGDGGSAAETEAPSWGTGAQEQSLIHGTGGDGGTMRLAQKG
jgi:hypothetical protein